MGSNQLIKQQKKLRSCELRKWVENMMCVVVSVNVKLVNYGDKQQQHQQQHEWSMVLEEEEGSVGV